MSLSSTLSMLSPSRIRHVRERRRVLEREINAYADFEAWEETCVPSYCHKNVAAAAVSWMRLFAAVDLADRHVRWGRVLDFGASIGELGRLLPSAAESYEFVEMEEPAAKYLASTQPKARRVTLEEAEDGAYACIFALDSLEHNKDYPVLLDALRSKLAPDGVLVLSGPTENFLYRLGRRIARFDAHYHETNIHAIEATARETLRELETVTVPMGVPLFRISAWRSK